MKQLGSGPKPNVHLLHSFVVSLRNSHAPPNGALGKLDGGKQHSEGGNYDVVLHTLFLLLQSPLPRIIKTLYWFVTQYILF